MVKMPTPPKNIFEPPQRHPLELIVQKIVNDLIVVWPGNGYKHIGFALLVQNLETDEEGDQPLCMAGNLRPEGLRPLLANATSMIDEELDGKPRIVLS